jgi:3-methyladenine DNA glycosylase AlkD
MTAPLTAEQFTQDLLALASSTERDASLRYFKDGDADHFIGVRMGAIFSLAKANIEMPLDQIERLLESHIHEVRMGALCIMDALARRKKTSDAQREAIFALYLRRHDRINNWDLVDRAAIHVVGGWLQPRSRAVLYDLARSSNLWERRTAMVSTGYFIRQGDVDETFKLAELLLHDHEDLIHKATGWMLREAGAVDRPRLLAFLDAHAAHMPRTALRYAIEHFENAQRQHYRAMKDTKKQSE